MKPETRTINDLFERDVRYVVPLYQRPYVWNEEEQWEPLWGDLLVLLEHQVASDGEGVAYSHFLGAIVLDQEVQAPGRIPVYTVIDGQQRLTTLQVLLAAAKSVAEHLEETTEAGLMGDLIINDPRKADGNERLKVWPTNVNRRAFLAVVLPDSDHPEPNDPDNLVQEAAEYFRDKIRDWVTDGDDGDHHDRLVTLRITLADLVKIVSITLESGDNAQIIFETLNARGTPLLALDLVKNAVFHEASRQGRDIDRLYEEVWRPELDRERWRKERRQGRLNRAQGELFLMHWLGMTLMRVVPATELFTTYRKNVIEVTPRPDMEELIERLNRDAAIYASFDTQPAGSREALFFERLEALDVTTLMPLVLQLFTHPAIEAGTRRASLEYLESWLVRRMLTRLTTKNYNRIVAELIGKVAADPAHADEVIRDQFLASDVDTLRWPDDGELRTVLETRDLYNSITQARIVLLLRAVELSMYDDSMDVPTVPTRLSIEHVLPQRWERNWPLPVIADVEERQLRTSERNARLHRLGNLTLTTLKLNEKMSNSAWSIKQKQLNFGSKLLLNTQLIEQHPALFDEETIDARTRELARQVCRIWPRPAAS